MPDAPVAAPIDLRTKEGRELKAKMAAEANAVIATASVEIAKVATIPPVRAVSIMPPDEFVAKFTIQNADAITRLSGQPNPVASMADACFKAYRAYLLLVSDAFSAWTKGNAMDATTKFLPTPSDIWASYDKACGK